MVGLVTLARIPCHSARMLAEPIRFYLRHRIIRIRTSMASALSCGLLLKNRQGRNSCSIYYARDSQSDFSYVINIIRIRTSMASSLYDWLWLLLNSTQNNRLYVARKLVREDYDVIKL